MDEYAKSYRQIDILIHSIAFSPEIKNKARRHQPGRPT